MHIVRNLGHVFGGSLLIAGTTIGVGILAMPIATAPGGFFPAITIFFLCWIFMLCTGLLLLEVCYWMPDDANFITMTGKMLGPVGKIVCWLVYLFLFLAVLTAHVAIGGGALYEMTFGAIGAKLGMVIYVIAFAPIVYFGTKWVDRINILLMTGLITTYILLVAIAAKHINFDLYKDMDWSKAWFALPVLFTAFTYQVIVPTLVTYMDRNFKKIRITIIIGSSIPLIIYLIWEFTILGIVPAESLIRAGELGQTAVIPLKYFLDSKYLFPIGKYFSFFTMTVSHIAISLAYLDFLADGLKMKKTGLYRILLLLMVFVPPTIISLYNPAIFLTALRYTGGVSIAILFGLFPPLMVWSGRYFKKLPKLEGTLSGGRLFLSFLILLILTELVTDLFLQC